MNTDNSFSSNSMSKKRERLEEGERLNARVYKKLFQIAGQQLKEASQGGDHHITASDASNEINETETIVLRSCSVSKHERHSAELSESQFEVSSEVRDHVNKLREYWHRGHNSVFFDGQDWIIKVVQFVLSILDSVKQPILIITPPRSSMSSWESEFSKWSNSTNVVTYKGKKDVRDDIRSTEFYSENGSVKFQVLLSSPDVILEDLKMLDQIKWELLVIDECQRRKVSKIFWKIKTFSVDMKLLTFTSEIVEGRQGYENILSLLDSKYKKPHRDADVDTNTLKERLAPFVAFECNLKASEIEEYWVPVHLSHVQIQQYCCLLRSNSEALSSCSRNTSSLHHILTQIQKCCDHPYLVDPTLRENLKTDKLLVKIKRSGLRVLVLFQSVVSKKITIGDILEDLVDRRFGKGSYVRIQPKIFSRSKRTEAVNKFNDIDSRTFICLLDYRDCQSAITLSSVDVAILFNSSWNPSNDVKDLQKLDLDPNRLKLFRLYSSSTIEEKALVLSKQGMSLESYTYWIKIKYKTCHRLLAWGASYLLNNHLKFPKSKSKSKSDMCFIDDLVEELSSMLRNALKTPMISTNAQQFNGVYSENIKLMGESENTKDSCSIEEYLMENKPNIFWSNLFKESISTRRRSGRLSRRVKMSFRNPYYWFGRYGVESVNDMENATTTSTFVRKKSRGKNAITSNFVKKKLRSKRKKGTQVKKSKLIGAQLPKVPSTCISDSSPLTVTPPVYDQSSETTPLDIELENIKKEQAQVTKLHEEEKSMLLSERENEISEIYKKYDTLIENSETCLTNKMKALEGCYDLVYANKLLAQTAKKLFTL